MAATNRGDPCPSGHPPDWTVLVLFPSFQTHFQELTVPEPSHPQQECLPVQQVSVQSLDDTGVRHVLPPAVLLRSARTLVEAGQEVTVRFCKDVLCPSNQQTEQDLSLWTADHGSCPDLVQACESQSTSHGCLVHQSFLGAAVHVCTGSKHCHAPPNNTDPAKRDPDLPEVRSRTPLLDHANETHLNQCRP